MARPESIQILTNSGLSLRYYQTLGLALADLAELFELYDDSQSEETQLFRLIQLLRAKKRELEIKQTNLEIVKEQIDTYERQCLKQIMDKGLIS